MSLSTAMFDYHLPPELIAQHPSAKRDGARMMVLERGTGKIEIHDFSEIVNYLQSGDLIVGNNTKVMACRLFGCKNGDQSGAKFEALQIEMIPGSSGGEWKAMLKPGKRAKAATKVQLLDHAGELSEFYFSVVKRFEDGTFEIAFSDNDYLKIQQYCGHLPLPPYIQRSADTADDERYQTVFARYYGAVAAPTAGLHFTDEIIAKLANNGVGKSMVTLHVGPGTFKPVSVEDVTRHEMHAESYVLPMDTADMINQTKRNGNKVLAIGTTTVRVLESCVNGDGFVTPGHGETRIFLYPPYQPKAAEMLLTNFHLPKSTLLMLISTYAPREVILEAYAKAIESKMRFYSYGDCMLLH